MMLFNVDTFLKQINESFKIVNETVNPDVFFSRYDFLLDRLEKLSMVEDQAPFQNGKPSKTLNRLRYEKDKAVNLKPRV